MHKLSRAAPYIAYAVATAGMAVLLLLGSSPGAVIARSYQAYNGCPVPSSPEYTYQNVNLPFSVPLSPVTAVEARAKKDGYILFGYPRCPYCRNLLPVLATVAESEGVRMDYCQIDLYRDIYAYSVDAAAPVHGRGQDLPHSAGRRPCGRSGRSAAHRHGPGCGTDVPPHRRVLPAPRLNLMITHRGAAAKCSCPVDF